ncbi:MAG: hypothetical protein QOF57_2557 [Frankiaceae bacterium]|jgi:uncharacterized protein|nr:hypothetical protein [Frankiaceae bacterium]
MSFAVPDHHRLDHRAPLVLDTRELGRRPGALQRVQRAVPAPGGWAVGLTSVPVDTDLHLDLRLESVLDGVLVSGAVTTAIVGECGRCLEPFTDEVEVDVQELFLYDGTDAGPDDEDVFVVVGDLIDIEPVVRDAVVLGLPLNPLCEDDCPGLCPTCGERLDVDGPEHVHDTAVDPRWAALLDRSEGQHPADPHDPHDPSAGSAGGADEKEI